MIQYTVPYDDKNVFVVYNPVLDVINTFGVTNQPFYIYLKPVDFKGQIDASKELPIGSFLLTALSGNCGGCIGYGMHTVHSQWIKPIDKIRDDLVRKFGYSFLVATAVKHNPGTERAIQDKDNGYEIVEEFKNKRTSHDIIVGFKAL